MLVTGDGPAEGRGGLRVGLCETTITLAAAPARPCRGGGTHLEQAEG